MRQALTPLQYPERRGRHPGLLGTCLPPVMFLVLFLLVWQFAIPALGVGSYILPPPLAIAIEILDSPLQLLTHSLVTLTESLAGFVVAALIGIGTAVLFVHCRTFERVAYPYIVAFKAVPLIALAPLLVLWFGNGMLSKVVMSALICFFPIVVSTALGLRDVSPAALDLMHSLSASRWQILTKLRFPSAAPHVFSALKVASTLSIIGSIVGELAGADRGIGYLIIVSSYRLETSAMFAAIVASAVAGVVLFGLISLLERRVCAWHHAYRRG